MKNVILGAIFGTAFGLFVAGTILHAQCCAQLDVPLNEQIEQEHQMITGGWNTPATPPHTNQDAWRSEFLKEPCR